MLRVKRQFPTEASLKEFVASNASAYTENILAELGSIEQEYIRARRTKRVGNILLMGGICGIFFVIQIFAEAGWFSGWLFGAVLLVCPIMIYKGWKMLRSLGTVIEEFNSKLNDQVYSMMFSFFGLEGGRIQHTPDRKHLKDPTKPVPHKLLAKLQSSEVLQLFSSERKQVLDLLDHSELVTEPRNRVRVDDMFSAEIANQTLFASELEVKHVTGSGKNRSEKKIFSGYFASFTLTKELAGKTFVTTEGDKKGFGHQSFMQSFKGAGVQETTLEWNDFEKKLHVVTDNPTEARYILTPDFMQDLYDWWHEKQENIRISFVADRMYVLFPDKKLRFGNTIPAIDTDYIQEYIETIALPFLHVLHLVEDVEKRL